MTNWKIPIIGRLLDLHLLILLSMPNMARFARAAPTTLPGNLELLLISIPLPNGRGLILPRYLMAFVSPATGGNHQLKFSQ
ncbi:MAG: hypothetical protein KJ057_14660 [Phycisphaerae bacterium]|nr:MAG: hypothetical protein F9K17_13595 [Phycisphaerae bacterium]MBE7455525.1 hypothetical protein [Planctomycetia bacterium]MCK6464887.1 hypothetical protein [Phycisphaerae bacterium]MCL4719709.1 hypothetical protein [Phycisphaerae bacterium]NUQ10044.1 hypothetical protein [Phycisphaerae bacterium]